MLIHNANVTGSMHLNGMDMSSITGSVSSTVFNQYTSSTNEFTSSTNTRLNSLDNASGSFSTRVTSLESFSSSLDATFATDAQLSSLSGSVSERLTTDESAITNNSSSFASRATNSESNISALQTASGSFSTRVTNAESSITSLNSRTGSFATIEGPNSFNGNQTITGSLFVTQNLTVLGSSSISFVSQSTLNIGTNLITVNAQNPTVRFGGLAVIDSGSVPQVSGSWLFDSIQNRWIMIHEQAAGAAVTSSIALMGPETYNNLGNETQISSNRLIKGYPGASGEHVGDSQISDDGTTVSIPGRLVVTGSITGSLDGSNITNSSISNAKLANSSVTVTAGTGLSGGGSVALGSSITLTNAAPDQTVTLTNGGNINITGTYPNFTLTNGITNNNQLINGAGYITGITSGNVTTALGYTPVPTTRTLTINGTSFDLSADRSWTIAAGVSSFNTRTGAITLQASDISGLGAGIVSGSSQVTGLTSSNLSSTANISNSQLANSSITVSAGTGMSGGGSVSLGGTITLTNTGLLSGTAGTGISVSTLSQNLTITNTGLLSGTAGTGISVSTVNQNLTITNTGLLTGTAGTGISVSTVNQNLTITNTGLLGTTAGTGISISTVNQNSTITNTGLLGTTAGTGISISTVNQNSTITNTGVTSNIAGTGISVSGATGGVTITNTGVTSLTAGSGISISGATGGVTVTNTITNNNQLTNGAGYITSAGTAAAVSQTVSGTNSAELVRGNMADNDQFRILVGGTASNSGFVEIATADDGTEPIHVRQYTGVFSSLVRTATLLDGSGNTSFPGIVTAGSDFRAPIFYDSNNTGFYLDPASTSVLNALTVGGSSVVTNNGGSWGISVTGTAGSTQTLALIGLGNGSMNVNNGNTATYRNENSLGAALPYAPVLHVGGGDTMWQAQGSYGTSGNGTFYFRQGYNGSWGNWLTMLSSANFNSYSPTLTGGGASGTWGISISGNAATAGGFTPSQSTIANGIVVRDPSGYIFGNYINMTDDGNPGGGTSISSFITKQGDNYYRSVSPTNAMVSIRGVASGTWSINVTGTASSETLSTVTGRGGSTTSQIEINRQTTINTTTPGTTTGYGLHFGGQTTADQATGITFSAGNATPSNANAGIYVQGSGAYGTRMYIATTDSYATGARTAITINEGGTVTINRSFLQSNTDLRAPIFYDSNNTAFFIDPGGDSSVRAAYFNGNLWINPRSESYGEGVTFNMPNQNTWGGLRWYRNGPGGGFAGNWAFGYFGNEANNDIGFHNGTNGWRLDHSFNMTSIGSVRSPIFFDSNDTGYFGDFAGRSMMNQIEVSRNGAYGGYTNADLIVGNGNADRRGFGATGGSSIMLRSSAKSTITALDENHNLGQIGYENLVWTIGEDIGWGVQTTVFPGIARSNTDMRAPIFYDQNNTGYYIDAASTSVLNDLFIDGDIRMNGSDSYIWMPNNNSFSTGFYDPITGLVPIGISGPSDGVSIGNNMWLSYNVSNINSYNENIRLYPANNSVSVIAFGATAGSTGGTPWNSLLGFSSYFEIRQRDQWQLRSFANYVEAFGDFRAPIFYDSNNTAFYIDPAGDLSIRVDGEIANSNYQQGAMQPGALNIGRTDRNYAWDGTSWASDIRLGIMANTSETWEFGIHDSGDSVMSMLHFDGGSTITMGRSIGWGTCNVTAASDFRAPIFYDSNNTGFYLDPASTSVLNAANISTINGRGTSDLMFYQGFTLDANTMGSNTTGFTYSVNAPFTGPIARFSTGGGYDMWIGGTYWGGNELYIRTRNGDLGTMNPWRRLWTNGDPTITAGSDFRAPIFYDSDNTGFFINPASGTNLNWLTINDWYYINGALGIYWNSYGRGFVAPEQAGNSYGTVTTWGSGRNGWNGWGIGSRHCFMSTGGDNVGVHDNSRGWIWYWTGSSFNIDYGFTNIAGSARSPIFYDSNDTGYYVDPNGTSYCNRFDTNQSYVYGWFRNHSNNTGLYNENTTMHLSSNANGYWDMSSTTSVSSIRFYTGGHVSALRGYVYANTSNEIGFLNTAGNWSLRVDNSGNTTATGDVTAYSDARVKTNVNTIENALEKTLALRGVTYNRTDSEDVRTKVGVIAQEIIEVLPEVVNQDSDGMYNVSYGNITALLIEAIKEQQSQIEELKSIVNALTK